MRQDILIVLIWTMIVFGVVASCDVTPGPAAGVPTATALAPASKWTAAPSPTPYVPSSPAPTATPAASKAAPTPAGTLPPLETSTAVSPDGNWLAEIGVSGPAVRPGPDGAPGEFFYARFVVRAASGSPVWTVVDGWQPYGLGYTSPSLVRWSHDGRFLYYTDYPHPDGCAPYVDGWGLKRLSLAGGGVEVLIADTGLVQSLAPDEHALLYRDRADLVLRDLATGSERRTPLAVPPGGAAGHIVWSPDGAAAVLEVADEVCNPDAPLSLVLYDLATLAPRVLAERDPRGLTVLDWPAGDVLLVRDRAGAHWLLDVATGALLPGVPQPGAGIAPPPAEWVAVHVSGDQAWGLAFDFARPAEWPPAGPDSPQHLYNGGLGPAGRGPIRPGGSIIVDMILDRGTPPWTVDELRRRGTLVLDSGPLTVSGETGTAAIVRSEISPPYELIYSAGHQGWTIYAAAYVDGTPQEQAALGAQFWQLLASVRLAPAPTPEPTALPVYP